MSVGELLAAARVEHDLYRRNVPHLRPGPNAKLVTVSGDEAKSIAHLRQALKLRLEADERDPKHTDPAWSEELTTTKHRHNDLVNWYRTKLADIDEAANGTTVH